ncbi:hypothetical protein TNCV_1961341 [Trichonephila clavipes]|nr:hypothetical protein TNCV_1961341 [Trichonephila clavipes]
MPNQRERTLYGNPSSYEPIKARSILEMKRKRRESARDKSAYPSTPYQIEAEPCHSARIFPPPPIKADNGEQEEGVCLHIARLGPPGKGAESHALKLTLNY